MMDETKTIPVILLSARAGEESKVEGLEAGADDYLIKPFTARELLARVSSHLAMVRMRSEAARTEQKLRLQVPPKIIFGDEKSKSNVFFSFADRTYTVIHTRCLCIS